MFRISRCPLFELNATVFQSLSSVLLSFCCDFLSQGGKEYLMRAHFGLPSVEAEDKEGKPPISVKFEIPYFTTSGIQVHTNTHTHDLCQTVFENNTTSSVFDLLAAEHAKRSDKMKLDSPWRDNKNQDTVLMFITGKCSKCFQSKLCLSFLHIAPSEQAQTNAAVYLHLPV